MKSRNLRFPPHSDNVHHWAATTDPLIQCCTRSRCKVLRTLQDGEWVELRPTRSTPSTRTIEPQPDLWTTRTERSLAGCGVPDECIAIIGTSRACAPGDWADTLNGECYRVIAPSTHTTRPRWRYDTPVDLRSRRPRSKRQRDDW